ncbi:MAG: hypothetical protein K6F99_10545, partial [Lachnospiraceae bacterium]|nr:hypothetical protein [Lachnospiraceae bacterium]
KKGRISLTMVDETKRKEQKKNPVQKNTGVSVEKRKGKPLGERVREPAPGTIGYMLAHSRKK